MAVQLPIVYFNQNGGGDFHDWASSIDVFTPGTVVAAPQVQDAFATPGTAPNLGPAELTALRDEIGYNQVSATPEPSQFGMLALIGLGLGGGLWRGHLAGNAPKRMSRSTTN